MFIIQEESGKWKMLIDLRAVNAIIAALMGALQPDLPNPNMIPRMLTFTLAISCLTTSSLP